jgi:hypothetical protein
MTIIRPHLQGRVKYPTGGDSPRAERQMQCDSATDSTVWMKEDKLMREPFALDDVCLQGFCILRTVDYERKVV